MSFATAQPEALRTAAGDLASIGAVMCVFKDSTASLTTTPVRAAADDAYAATAARFVHAQRYQLQSAPAKAIRQQFVAVLTSCGGWNAATESTRAAMAACPGEW